MASERAHKRSMWVTRIVLGLGLFLLVDALAQFVIPDLLYVDAAIAKCEHHGLKGAQLSGVEESWYAIGKTSVVSLNAVNHNQPVSVEVKLIRPLNLAPWLVTDYREQPRE